MQRLDRRQGNDKEGQGGGTLLKGGTSKWTRKDRDKMGGDKGSD